MTITTAGRAFDRAELRRSFAARTQAEGDHLVWTGHVDYHGAPSMYHAGHQLSAYRAAMILLMGQVPAEGRLRRTCDRRRCVEPRHVGRARQAAALLAARTRADGDHLVWTGSFSSRGMPYTETLGTQTSGLRLAFLVLNGRDPEGPVRRRCTYPGCVSHITDSRIREEERRTEALYAAIFGGGRP